jgi:hypothetical protein
MTTLVFAKARQVASLSVFLVAVLIFAVSCKKAVAAGEEPFILPDDVDNTSYTVIYKFRDNTVRARIDAVKIKTVADGVELPPEDYDFEANPNGYEIVEALTIPAFVDNITGDSVPAKTSYQFKSWNSKAAGNGDEYAEGDIVQKEKFIAGNFTVFAIFEETAESKELVSEIENTLKEIEEKMKDEASSTSHEYDDDHYIGSGDSTSGDAETDALMKSFNEARNQAAELLKGTRSTQTVEIDGFDDEGNNLTEDITIVTYDFEAIAAVDATLKTLMKNPKFDAVGGSYASTQLTFNFSGKAESVTVVTNGVYEFELNGASGGHLWSRNGSTATGGKGGHVKGKIRLNKGDVIKVRAGGEGSGNAELSLDENGLPVFAIINDNYSSSHEGGYNGGGNGGSSRDGTAGGGGGGGASDVRLVGTYSAGVNNKDNGVNDDGVSALDIWETRIAVAGGGGGSAQGAQVDGHNSAKTWPGLQGGDAGKSGIRKGETATEQGDYLAQYEGTYYGLNDYPRGALTEALDPVPPYASGTVLGKGATGSNGFIGQSSSETSKCWEGNGGGGGGYYGGEALNGERNSNYSPYTGAGAGGSSFFTTNNVVGTPEIDGINELYGNGNVVIKYVGR